MSELLYIGHSQGVKVFAVLQLLVNSTPDVLKNPFVLGILVNVIRLA